MITVAQAVGIIVSRSRYLNEAMSKNLINLSSLARYIKPELEEMVFHTVSDAAILMALTRLQKTIKPVPQYKNFFTTPPEITVRSQFGLALFDSHDQSAIQTQLDATSRLSFYHVLETNEQISLLAPLAFFAHETYQLTPHTILAPLAVITIILPKNAIDTPGAFYFFLKSLAWENISLMEVRSMREAFSIIVHEKDANKTFDVINSLFRSKSEIF